MISLRLLIFATTLLSSGDLFAAVNDPIITGPGPGSCESKSTGSSADPTIKSLNWSINVGLAPRQKPTSLASLHLIGFEKDGNLPNYQEMVNRSFSADPLQQEQVKLTLSQPKISEETFHPSCLSLEPGNSMDVLYDNVFPGPDYIHQILTDDAFTLIEIPDGGIGWRVRVWKRQTTEKPELEGGFFVTTSFTSRTPLNDVLVIPPDVDGEFNRFEYWQTETTGVGGAHSYTYVIEQQVDLNGRPFIVNTKKFSGIDAAGPLLTMDSITYSGNSNTKLWEYNIVRETYAASVDAAGTIGSLAKTASTLEVYKDYSIGSAGNTIGGVVGMKRLESITQAYNLAGQAPQTTTHTYVNLPDIPSVHGRLMSTIKPDGSWVYYEYQMSEGSPFSISTEYSGWKDLPIGQRENARKTITTVTPYLSTAVTFVAGGLVAMSRHTLSASAGSPVIMTSGNLIGIGAGSELHTTTTAYSVGERPVILWSENSDGSAVTYSYSSVANETVITKRSGAGSRDGVISGSQTVTSLNLGNYPTSEITTDITTNLVIERWDTDLTYNSGFDALGRPIKRIYNADTTDYDITQYACCGLDFFRDRMGGSTQYFRDPLKRVYKIETKASAASPVVTDFVTLAVGSSITGLIQTRSRKIGIQSLFLDTTIRSLDGLTRIVTGPARKSALVADRPVTTSVTSHSASGDIETTTFADGSTAITTNYFDGRIKSTTGTAVPDMTYDYTTHTLNGGGEATITTASGVVTSQFFDHLGRLIKVDSGVTGITLYTYHSTTAAAGSRGKLATSTDGDGVATSYGYDAEGQLITTIRTIPLATGTATRVTTTTRDVVANVVLQGRNLGVSRRQTKTLGATGLPTVTTSESFVATAGLISGSRSFGRETLSVTTRPDAAGLASTIVTQPDGTKSVQLRTHGLVTAVQNLSTTGSIITATTYGYDTLQRLITSTDARTGTTTLSALTESGQPLTTTAPGNLVTTSTCDIMGRKISTTLPDATVNYTSYYPTGLVKATWGSQTYPTWLAYDEENRLTKLHTWKSAPILTATTAVVPINSDVTTWIYSNNRGLLTRKQYADTKGTDFTYTPGGKLATRTWARGVVTTYSYNQGLLTLTDYSDSTPDVARTYDGYSRQSTVTQTNQSQIAFSYNPTTLFLTSELVKYDIDGNGSYEFTRTLDRSRDALLRDTGFILGTTPASGVGGGAPAASLVEAQAAYAYSPTDGRTSQISNPLIPNHLFSYTYLPSSDLLSAVTGPIHTVTNVWEPTRDVLDTKQNKVGTTVISNYDYAVNAIGQRTIVATSGTAFPAIPSWLWSYDALGQVIAADSTVATSDRSFQYDSIGNRKKSANSLTLPASENYVANVLNQYSSLSINNPPSTINLLHDFDGNLTSGPLPTAQNVNSTLKWDAENRLISSPVGTTINTYRYDAQSRRITKFTNSSIGLGGGLWFTKIYLYDAWNCIAQYETANTLTPYLGLEKTYLWGIDLSGTLQGAGGVGGLLSNDNNPLNSIKRPVYPTYDGNGNVSEYLSAAGTIAAHFEYDPFGNTVVNTDTSNLFAYRFSTKPRDKETGLYYYGYRYYDPKSGRWPSRDLIWENGGVNLYGNSNDFVNAVDLLGWIPCSSPNSCGEAGANEATELTKKNDGIEYCGSICCNSGKYTRTEAKKGRKGGCDSTIVSPCPEGSKEVGIFHSHPTNSDFSYPDYESTPTDGSNYLGRPDGVRRIDKTRDKETGVTKPKTLKRGNDGKYYPYPPENNGLRADMGYPYLDNGTSDPYQTMR